MVKAIVVFWLTLMFSRLTRSNNREFRRPSQILEYVCSFLDSTALHLSSIDSREKRRKRFRSVRRE